MVAAMKVIERPPHSSVAEPSWSVLTHPERYVHSSKHGDPKAFRERLRTADYFQRDSDGQDGEAQPEEEER
jgi:hypothetical protein